MKKKILVLFLAILALTLGFASCTTPPTASNASVTAIAVIADSVQTEFSVGDTPDFSNIKVAVNYDDGTTGVVGYSDVTVSLPDTSTAGSKTVTVTYKDVSTTFSVNVIEKEIVLESIRIVSGSVASSVKRGKVYDTSSLQVEGVYSNGTVKGLPIADVTVSGIDTSTAGDKTLTVTYQDMSASLTVTVIDITDIKVLTNSVATKIPVGTALDTSNVSVTVVYADNTTENVSAIDLTIGTIDSSSYGKKGLSISYKGFSISYQIEVVGPMELTILNSEGFVREVMVGGTVNVSAIQASVRYSDGTDDTVAFEELTVGTVDTSTAGVKKLTVQYASLTAEVDITVVGVASMTVESGSVVSEILKGQSFDVSGIRVNGTYTNGQTFAKELGELTVSGSIDGNVAGEQKITVKFLDKTVEHTVKVCEISAIVATGIPISVPAGEKVDVSRLTVYAVYNDSKSTRVLLESGYTHNADSLNTNVEHGVVRFTVKYGELSYSVLISNVAPELDGIVIDTFNPNVRVDEAYDEDWIKITALYGNGAQQIIDEGFTISVTDINSGEKLLTVSYTEGGITKTATKVITVVGIRSISVIGGSLPTAIGKGQSFDASGVRVTVTYNDNTTKTVSTGITVTGYDSLVAGSDNVDKITVTYMGVSCKYSCHVKAVTGFTIYSGLEHVKRTGYATSVDKLRLLLTYSNSTQEIVYAKDLACVTYDGLEAGNVNFAVKYQDEGMAAPIVVAVTLVKADIYQIHALNGTVPGYVLQGDPLSFKDFRITVIYQYTYNGEQMEEVYLIGLDDPRLTANWTEEQFNSNKETGDRIIQFTYDTGEGYSLTASAKVVVKGITSIEIVPGSILTTVTKGQEVDTSTLQIKVIYSDGTYKYVYNNSSSSGLTVTLTDKENSSNKLLTVTYGGFETPATVEIKVVNPPSANAGMIFAAVLPDDILVRDTYQKNFKAYANGDKAPYYVGDDNPFVLYLNVAVLNSDGLLEEIDECRNIQTAVKVYDKDGKELTGTDLEAVVKFDPTTNTYDFTEAATAEGNNTYTLEITPNDPRYTVADAAASTKTLTVTVVDAYNVYHAYELNLITNVAEDTWWFDGKGMTEDQVFSQGTVVAEFLRNKGILQYRDGLKGVVIHKDLTLEQNDQRKDLPEKYFVSYEKDGKKETAMVDAIGLFNHVASVGETFSIYGNCFSIFTYNLDPVAHNGFGNNDDPYSSSTLFELQANTEDFKKDEYANSRSFPFDQIKYNICDLALRDNDPHSNDQKASERHIRGISAFQVGSSTVNMNNVNIDAFMMSVATEEDGLTLNLKNVKFYNAWQGHLFLWSHNKFYETLDLQNERPSESLFGIKVDIKTSLLAKCGGPVILAQNANRDLECNYGMSIDVVVDAETDRNLYSYVTGEEAWFVAVNQVALAKKILLANDGISQLSSLLNVFGKLDKPASFLSTTKITGVPTVNMKMVIMGNGDLAGGSIAEHRGSYTVVDKTVMNMKINDGENTALKDLMAPTANGSLPILQSSGGGIAYQDVETNTLKPYAPEGIIEIPPELSGMLGIPAGTKIPYPDTAVFEGDYLNIYMQGIGILLEYYH